MGGLGKVHQVFGDELNGILEEMNEVLGGVIKKQCRGVIYCALLKDNGRISGRDESCPYEGHERKT
jgi:hypothetical protein